MYMSLHFSFQNPNVLCFANASLQCLLANKTFIETVIAENSHSKHSWQNLAPPTSTVHW